MVTGWPLVPLKEVLTPVSRPEPVDPRTTYRILGAHWYAQGLYTKEIKNGQEIRANKVYRVEQGDFVYNRLFAWKGSFAVATIENHGCYVSNEFPCFVVKRDRLDGQYLWRYFSRQSEWTKALGLSSGGTPTSRNRLKQERLLSMTIPLPSLDEQRRIVARIEELAAQIEEANNLTGQTRDETKVLWTSILTQACSGAMTAGRVHTLPDVETAQQLLERISNNKWPGHAPSRKRRPMSLPSPPKIPLSWAVVEAGQLQERGAILDIQDGNHGSNYPRKSEFAEEGVPFVTAHQIADGKVNISAAPKLPSERAARLRIGFAKAGDVLLTHNASVGGVAIAPPDAGDFLIGTSVTYWRCNPAALEPRYLYYFMQSEHFQRQLQFIMKQTTRNQVSVLKQVNLWICVPPLAEQRQIAVELEALHQRLESLKRLESESAVELDALLPAIIDRAFKGEL
jgi:type I restriction enzyme S subunit